MRCFILLGLCVFTLASEGCRYDQLVREGRTAPVEVLFLLEEGRKQDAAALFPRLQGWIHKRHVLGNLDSKPGALGDERLLFRTIMNDPSPQVDCALIDALKQSHDAERRHPALRAMLAEREAAKIGIFKTYASDGAASPGPRRHAEGIMPTIASVSRFPGSRERLVEEFTKLSWPQRRAVVRAFIEDRMIFRAGDAIESVKDDPSPEVDRMIGTALASVIRPDERERIVELNDHRRSLGLGVHVREFKYYLRATGQRAEYD